MRILINNKSEIIGYSLIGDISEGIDINIANVPKDFFVNFQSKMYIFNDGTVVLNDSYQPDESDIVIPDSIDMEIRIAFGKLQMSCVKTAKMVMDLTQQVGSLTKQNVELQKQLNDKAGE